MVRHPRSTARAGILAVAVAVAVTTLGCGIKGPLKPAPKAEAGKAPAEPDKRGAPPEPRL